MCSKNRSSYYDIMSGLRRKIREKCELSKMAENIIAIFRQPISTTDEPCISSIEEFASKTTPLHLDKFYLQ